MVRVQMRFSLVKSFAQFLKNPVNWRRSQIELSELRDNVRLPAAIHTPPLVADEAENSQSAIVGVIAAGCRSPSPLIVLPLRFPFVLRAVPFPIAERLASRRVAWTFGQARHSGLVRSPV
jgi:hypothetical protein